MEYLNPKNCKRLTGGYNYTQILSLTGIYGIHSAKELEKRCPDDWYCQSDIHGKIVNVEFETDLLKELSIRIDLANKDIKDEKLISTGLKSGISFKWLLAQIDAAISMGFSKIVIDAYGNKKIVDEYNGYIVWGKYGFRMSSYMDKKEFRELMIRSGRSHRDLFELLSSEGGVEFWTEHGRDWLGEFNLASNSKSMRIFREIRKQKEL